MIGKLVEALEAAGTESGDGLRKPGILIADDMGLILALLKLELEPRGFAVWLAADGDQAVDLYRRHGQEIDLALLDVNMPGMDGPQTLAVLQTLNPDVLACFMTGNPGAYTEDDLLERGAACVLKKPFPLGETAHFLQLLIDSSIRRTASIPATLDCDWPIPQTK